ncbi:sideroflexin-2-like [Lasioglossum baleicum]|uniref:sideroflexin-2-like n=1 Tax=Lasioglossum baleicum TaxID=434251 RepID=UPI003FCD322B
MELIQILDFTPLSDKQYVITNSCPICLIMKLDKIDIDQPLWDQSTYIGRWKHYAFISDTRIVFVPTQRLLEAKQLCEDYKNGNVPPGTTMKDVIYAKKLRDSSFHPDNGQLMYKIGRMCFQLPVNIVLTTAMLTFYKSTTAIVMFQTINQTHNAILNYVNRNALGDQNSEGRSSTRIAFLCAILASSIVAVGCRKLLRRRGPTIEVDSLLSLRRIAFSFLLLVMSQIYR